MAKGYAKLAFEDIPGNETNETELSTKVIFPPLRSIELPPNPSHLMREDELRNVDEPLEVLPEAFAPTWSLTTAAYPDVVGFLLSGILGPPTSTPGDGIVTDPDGEVVPAGAHMHVWEAPYGPAGPSPQTMDIVAAWQNEGFFAHARGCATEQLQLATPESGGATLTANGPALFLERVADPGLTPTFESLAIPPFMRGHLQIQTWLGGTATTEDFSLTIAQAVEAVRSLGIASMFPDIMEKGDQPVIVSGSIPKRRINAADWDALVNATRFAVMVRWQSTAVIGATNYPYALWLECDGAQYTGGGANALENKRRIGASFDWRATFDGAGASSRFTLVNSTASYA